MTNVTPKEAQRARAFLLSKGFNSNEIPPKLFAITAKKTGKPFGELLKILAIVKSRGQGRGQSELGDILAKND